MLQPAQGVARVEQVSGSKQGDMVSGGVMGVWGIYPQWSPEAKPLIRRSGGKAPDAEERLH